MLNSREENISCGVFHLGLSQLGAQFPGDSSVVRFRKERGRCGFAAPPPGTGRTGPDRSAHESSEVKVLPLHCCGQRGVKELEGTG